MPDELVPAGSTALAAAIGAAAEFAQAAKAKNTLRGYAADWRHFSTWCESVGFTPLPAHPGQVTAYLGALAARGTKTKTIERRITAIRHYHLQAGHENPCLHAGVKATLHGIRRTISTRPAKKAALTADLVTKAIRKIPENSGRLIDLRDRALLLLGFAGALRRSELVAFDVGDVARHAKGIVLTLRRSKTDQAGAGIAKAIPHGHRLKAVAALDAWLAAAAITSGPLFRAVRGAAVKDKRLGDKQVARIVKKRFAAIGLDAAALAGHSLRSGFITSASDAGAGLAKIAGHAGHAKIDTTLGYVQVSDAFRDHPGKTFL
jgi:site-specific recombinase XerD